MANNPAQEKIHPHVPVYNNYKIIATGISGTVIGLTLTVLVFVIGEKADHTTTFLVGIAGALSGWVMGVITTPYDETDSSKIDKFTKLLGTFLSGYILAKLDKVFENLLSIKNFDATTSGVNGVRILFFLCYFFLFWVVVFVYRSYSKGIIPPKKVKADDTDATVKPNLKKEATG